MRSFGILRARRDQRGAAAVEFALIAPMLFSVLFGIITYGMWLDDSMNLRQGVREAARQAVVGNYGADSCTATYDDTSTPTANMKALVCQTKADVSAYTGDTYVKVLLPDGWQRGREVVVCAMIDATRLPGLVPLPHGGLIMSETRMSIEVATPGQSETGGEEVLPPGADWSWCS
ncbi:MAG TPA: TadE/TadG family type IV pilus assembly protein [Nocardioidaceae bacterium]|nr:TadE/TadG family type IV pilus assembly protein [Nocardioidaceae bacterium]